MENRKGILTPKMPFGARFFAAWRNRLPIAFLSSWCRNCGTIVCNYHNPTEKIRQ